MKKRSWVIALCIALLTVLLPAGQVEAQQVEEEEKKKSGKRAIDVARESGYQLDDRYQPAGSIITGSIPGRFYGRRIKMFPGLRPV